MIPDLVFCMLDVSGKSILMNSLRSPNIPGKALLIETTE